MTLPVEFYRQTANAVTYARVMGTGAILGSLVVAPEEDKYSWGRASAYAVTGAGDRFDGFFVSLHPDGPNPDGAKLDEESDKAASYATELTLSIKQKDPFALASVMVDVVRDSLVRKKRKELRDRDLDAKARKFGKYKTAWKFATNTLALSPIGEKCPKIIRAMRIGGMALSIASGVDIIRNTNKQISEYDSANTLDEKTLS